MQACRKCCEAVAMYFPTLFSKKETGLCTKTSNEIKAQRYKRAFMKYTENEDTEHLAHSCSRVMTSSAGPKDQYTCNYIVECMDEQISQLRCASCLSVFS